MLRHASDLRKLHAETLNFKEHSADKKKQFHKMDFRILG